MASHGEPKPKRHADEPPVTLDPEQMYNVRVSRAISIGPGRPLRPDQSHIIRGAFLQTLLDNKTIEDAVEVLGVCDDPSSQPFQRHQPKLASRKTDRALVEANRRMKVPR